MSHSGLMTFRPTRLGLESTEYSPNKRFCCDTAENVVIDENNKKPAIRGVCPACGHQGISVIE